MLKTLFASDIRIQLLSRFLMNPEREYYGRELTQMLGSSSKSVHAELKNMESIDLLHKRISGKQHYYSVNTRHPIYRDLQNIFRKTLGLKGVVAEALAQYTDKIEYAFIYGSFATEKFTAESDVDLMIIGEVSSRKIASDLMEAGRNLEREINYSVFSHDEFLKRLQDHDHFITSIAEGSKLFALGDPDEFDQVVDKWSVTVS